MKKLMITAFLALAFPQTGLHLPSCVFPGNWKHNLGNKRHALADELQEHGYDDGDDVSADWGKRQNADRM